MFCTNTELTMVKVDNGTPRGVYRSAVQGYLAQEKQCPPRNLQQDFALGPMVVLEGG